MIYGELEGVRKSYINQLEELYEIRNSKYKVIEEEVLKSIVFISHKICREICLVISRSGILHSISIGTKFNANIEIDNKRDRRKLNGYRVIHTHINSTAKLSEVDINSLNRNKFDLISAISIDKNGFIDQCSLGFLNIDENKNIHCDELIFNTVEEYFDYDISNKIEEIEKNIVLTSFENTFKESAILVGCDTEESLQELKELTYACDVEVLETMYQKREIIDKSYYVGSGKLEQINDIIRQKEANLLVFDEELTPSQVRNIEKFTNIKVIDRTSLILEIFARRAKSKISKYQVELAQLKYRYSRLQGLGFVLNRTGGGIGTRGPGEKKLETDRRHIRNRIDYLKNKLLEVKLERQVQRDNRIKNRIPQVSIVGYTNAGKSTLRNYIYSLSEVLRNDDKYVFEADLLFATLEATTRKIILPRKTEISLTDTVGFIKKLPHYLVETFKSTLEEIIFSDLIIHLVDISSKNWEEEIKVTEEVLKEIGVNNSNKIIVFNKIDKLTHFELEKLKKDLDSSERCFISVKQKLGIDILLNKIEDKIRGKYINVSLLVPYSDYFVLNSIHNSYIILEEKHLDEGTYVNLDLLEEDFNKYSKYSLTD